jgi:hypothetical protein
MPETEFPRIVLLGHVRHPDVTRSIAPVGCLRGNPLGSSVNSARSRSYAGGVGPGPIGPGRSTPFEPLLAQHLHEVWRPFLSGLSKAMRCSINGPLNWVRAAF